MALIRSLPPLGRRLNRASPFARGLVLATLPYDWRGDSTGPQGPGTVAGTLALKDATGGRAIDFSGGGSLTFPRAPYLPPPCTVLIGYTPVSGYSQALFSCGTASDGWMLFQGNSNGLDISVQRFGKSTDALSYQVTPGKPVVIALTFDATPNYVLYADGVAVTTTPPGSLPFVSAAALELGNVSQGGYPFKGALHFALVYNRVLSAAEVASLSEDPYRILTKPRLLFAPASGGGSTTATGTLSEVGESLGGTATASDATTGTATEAGAAIAGGSSSTATASGTASEAGESASATATASDATTGAVGEAGESLGGTATVSESASGGAAQAGESLTGNTGAAPNQASGTITQAGESLSGTSSSSTSASGSAGETESLTGTASAAVAGSGSVTQDGESASGSAAASVGASGALGEAGQAMSGAATAYMPDGRILSATFAMRPRYAETCVLRPRYLETFTLSSPGGDL